MHIYEVRTEKFGTILYEAENIAHARAWARRSFGIGPDSVSRQRAYKRCTACDSQPCTCEQEVNHAR